MKLRTIFLVLLLSVPATAIAETGDWDLAGNLELESRFFTQDARWPGQSSPAATVALVGQAELRWSNDDSRVSLIPYVRWDSQDDERSLFDLREAYWAHSGDDYEILVGANTVFWGVTESVHLVDIINQTDFAADLDGEQKLGQPMVNLALQRDWGAVDIFVLPWFRERTFVGADGRLRPPVQVDADDAVYTSSAGQNHVDFAVRYSHYIGDADIGVSYFNGTSREARWNPGDDGTSLVPAYDLIEQIGVDLQYTREAWLWKLEAIVRDGYSHTFAAATAGFEFTLYQVRESDADLGLLLEYQYDGRNELEPVSINDNDVFVGARLAMNDVQDSAILAGVAYDTRTGETLFRVEADRRFGEDWVVEAKASFFSGSDVDDPTYALSNDDYVEIRVAKYF